MTRTSILLTVTTRELASIRDWFREHGTPAQCRLKAKALLREYIRCQLISNAEWDGQTLDLTFHEDHATSA